MEEKMRQLGRNVLIPINLDAGCIHVYFLEPSLEHNNSSFGVVSIWKDKETLNRMKNSERYGALLEQLAPLMESFADKLYFSK
jgi:quinol monooxygenase YgiN